MNRISRWLPLAAAAFALGACTDMSQHPMAPIEGAEMEAPSFAIHTAIAEELYLIDNQCGNVNPSGDCEFQNGSIIYQVTLPQTGPGAAVLTEVVRLEGNCAANASINCSTFFDQSHIGATPGGQRIYAINRRHVTVNGVTGNPLGYYEVGAGRFIYAGIVTGIAEDDGVVLAGFGPDGFLYAGNQDDDRIYRINVNTRVATSLGQVVRNDGTNQALNMVGADLSFDASGVLWIWSNGPMAEAGQLLNRGLWRVADVNAPSLTATRVDNTQATIPRFMTGLAIRDGGRGDAVLSNQQDNNFYVVNRTTGAVSSIHQMTGALTNHRFGDMTTGRLGPPPVPGTCPVTGPIGGIDLGQISEYLFVFTDANRDANWQSSSRGYVGNVAIRGTVARERTSGSFGYAGTIFTDAPQLRAWQRIVDNNPGQAASSGNETARINALEAELKARIVELSNLPATTGFASRSAASLNGLDFSGSPETRIVINVTSGLGVSSRINIGGRADQVIIIRWDTDGNPANLRYEGQVKFQSGGAIVPQGGLTPSNFIHVAGDINSSGGGSTPPPPFPQGPRLDDGQGALIGGGSNFSGGGFFTGYWLTTGKPSIRDAATGIWFGETASFSNAIFVGGWYSMTTKFSMTSGTSAVHICPNEQTIRP
jgi:hypothetical protein